MSFSSAAVGSRVPSRRKAKRTRAAAVGPACFSICSPSTRAASTNWGSSSSTSACSGVLVVWRRAVQTSRLGTSKAVMFGIGAVRFQTV